MVVGVGWTYNIFLFGTSAYIKEFTLYIVYLKDQVACSAIPIFRMHA